ncbi:hypothetical protein M758_4G036600 [Ceratodon purpureus]|nr:hypothetical protein M758_4G036600 [Ceratodon purpureus]
MMMMMMCFSFFLPSFPLANSLPPAPLQLQYCTTSTTSRALAPASDCSITLSAEAVAVAVAVASLMRLPSSCESWHEPTFLCMSLCCVSRKLEEHSLSSQ